ncbi:DUF1427 family protein [Erwinia sp. 198]|uniref:DUF1427 family protein n=1 Tax=Erwinia sp. 198 TaxID=2022746 RepID=UPI000F65C949|nr:DUF1427 family protein [Erwinia sp. 198]RRZ86799.1 DUF1427 family protein [Erwinia sp. 198]
MLKIYSVSLAVGVLAGVIYAVLGVSSPAPPLVALAGLAGMQPGEHIIPLIKRLLNRQPVNLRWFRHEYHHKIGDNPPSSGG